MDFSKEALKRPDNRYAVTYTWGWNAPITREGIDRELERMKLAGIRSLYIIPLPISFRPETNRSFLFPDYLTEEFFDLVKYAINRAKEMGIGAWLYDEGGWPSGGACTHTLLDDPDAAVRFVKTREVTLMRAFQGRTEL